MVSALGEAHESRWKGRRLSKLTKEELIEALEQQARITEHIRKTHAKDLDMLTLGSRR